MISARHDFMEFNVSFDVTVLIVVDIRWFISITR